MADKQQVMKKMEMNHDGGLFAPVIQPYLYSEEHDKFKYIN